MTSSHPEPPDDGHPDQPVVDEPPSIRQRRWPWIALWSGAALLLLAGVSLWALGT